MGTPNPMTPERWKQVKEFLGTALEIDSARRSEYLDQACGQDASLRDEIRRLLAVEQRAGAGFLNERAPLDSLQQDLSTEQDNRVGQVLGSYRVICLIGEGGMGAVYRAIRADDQYQSQVAIKLVHAGQDSPSVISRFKNERQILASLDHPNIAHLHDGGTTPEGVPYFVMELIEGEPITEYCDHHKVSVDARLKLFLEVCSAVQYAHRRLIVHRDIKPRNILVTQEGVPKLLDFGIAKIVDPGMSNDVLQTMMSLRVFTPAYASPEQVRGDPITTASDVYSLGVVLYELLTGRHPYPLAAKTPETLSRAVCEHEPERLSAIVRRTKTARLDRSQEVTLVAISTARDCSPEKLSKRLSGDLDKIVLMSLRKEPDRRYGSVEQFAEDIRRHLGSLPVLAHGDALGYRARKFVNRHRAGIVATVVASLALIVGTFVSVREARIARAERARAERRFNDVRKLSNSLMFDIHDAIRDLPGSTAARKILLDKALQYLDSLAGEAGNDPALLRELATAYERVAEVQGHFLNDNLGDTGGSLRTYQKALALRQQLAGTAGSNWQDRLALANSSRAVASELLATGQPTAAVLSVRNAIATAESLRRERPNDTKVLDELAYDYEIEGHIEGGSQGVGLGDLAASMSSYLQAVETEEAWLKITPDETSALHSYATDLLFLADTVKASGNLQEALIDYNRCLEIAKTVSQRTGSARRLRDVAVAYNRVGEIYEDEHNWRKALEQDQQALDIYRQLLARDPNDFIMRQGFAIALANVGIQEERMTPNHGLADIDHAVEMMEKIVAANKENAEQRGILASMYNALGDSFRAQHKPSDALREYQKVLAINERLYAGDPNNVDAMLGIAGAKANIAEALAAMGKFDAASESFSEALAAVKPALSAPKPDDGVLTIAAKSFAGLGDLELRLADHSDADAPVERKHWDKARNLFLMSRDTWQKLPPTLQHASISPDLSDADNVRRKLERCEIRLKATDVATKQ